MQTIGIEATLLSEGSFWQTLDFGKHSRVIVLRRLIFKETIAY